MKVTSQMRSPTCVTPTFCPRDVVGPDHLRQPEGLERLLEGGEREFLLCGGERLAGQQIAARKVVIVSG